MKHQVVESVPDEIVVAPCAGARIETGEGKSGSGTEVVAPCAGARIETSGDRYRLWGFSCRPLRGGAD